jgi:hypothetical protein
MVVLDVMAGSASRTCTSKTNSVPIVVVLVLVKMLLLAAVAGGGKDLSVAWSVKRGLRLPAACAISISVAMD